MKHNISTFCIFLNFLPSALHETPSCELFVEDRIDAVKVLQTLQGIEGLAADYRKQGEQNDIAAAIIE
jgi:hypothetical protein